MKRVGLFLIFALLLGGSLVAQTGEDPAITYLLHEVETSSVTFIRNGKPYPGKAAAVHMRRKARHFAKEIQMPEDFIRLVGTKSEASGRPYEIKLPDGRKRPAADWLTGLLRRYRDTAAK